MPLVASGNRVSSAARATRARRRRRWRAGARRFRNPRSPSPAARSHSFEREHGPVVIRALLRLDVGRARAATARRGGGLPRSLPAAARRLSVPRVHRGRELLQLRVRVPRLHAALVAGRRDGRARPAARLPRPRAAPQLVGQRRAGVAPQRPLGGGARDLLRQLHAARCSRAAASRDARSAARWRRR